MLRCPHCSQLSTIMFSIVSPDSGSTILFHIVDNCEQCGQQNIVIIIIIIIIIIFIQEAPLTEVFFREVLHVIYIYIIDCELY